MGDTIQGRTLYKGGHYLRKYGNFLMKLSRRFLTRLVECVKISIQGIPAFRDFTILIELEVNTKRATAADFVYTSESNESCEEHSTHT